MTFATYDIIAPDTGTVDWPQCDLVIVVNHRFFHYVILEGKKNLVALKFYQFTPTPEKNFSDLLEDILAGDELLHKGVKTAAVIYTVPESQLVPQALYNPALNGELMNLGQGDLQKGTVFSEKMADTDIYNLYRVPAAIHELLENKFAPEQFRHFYSVWLEQENSTAAAERISVLFYPNELLVLLIKDNRFHLAQQITYQTIEDAAYHLLNIYHQYGLSPNELPLCITGMVDADSALYEELLKYFRAVEMDTGLPGWDLPAGLNAFPAQFFSPILKTAACVL